LRFNKELIQKKIETSLRVSGEYNEQEAYDISFHMTDWLNDLEKINDFYSEPETLDNANVEDLLRDFLLHAPEHIVAAKKLLIGFGVSDVFKVGAVIAEENK
jgi:hypothetical protein